MNRFLHILSLVGGIAATVSAFVMASPVAGTAIGIKILFGTGLAGAVVGTLSKALKSEAPPADSKK